MIVIITATGQTERVDGVETRVVEGREWLDGEPAEASRKYLATCRQTDSVFYFGENVDNYEGGVIVDHDGSWRADDGNSPGLMMPGTGLLGSRYHRRSHPAKRSVGLKC